MSKPTLTIPHSPILNQTKPIHTQLSNNEFEIYFHATGYTWHSRQPQISSSQLLTIDQYHQVTAPHVIDGMAGGKYTNMICVYVV